MTLARLRLTALCLLAAGGGFAWACHVLASTPISIGEMAPAAAWTPGLAQSMSVGEILRAGEADPAILARLVFSPTRRPPEPKPAEPEIDQSQPEEAPPPAPVIDVAPPEGLVLQGIFIEESRRQALITAADRPDGVWLKLGTAFDGWTILRIEPGGIAMANGDREVEFTLYVDNLGK